MKIQGKTFCDTHCRHLRFIFSVDQNVSGKFITDLIMDNYQLWGGRYNSIIPVYGHLFRFLNSVHLMISKRLPTPARRSKNWF
jgi:hypothetical protein